MKIFITVVVTCEDTEYRKKTIPFQRAIPQYPLNINQSNYTFCFVSLGSTRFFKVARARHKGALIVVKVFVLHDPTLPLVEHKEKLEFLNRELSPKNNCLPFAKPVVIYILFKVKIKSALIH